MIEWQEYDREAVSEVFARGSREPGGLTGIQLFAGKRDGEWGLWLGHMLLAVTDTERATRTAFDMWLDWVRRDLGPDRIASIEE